MQAGDGLWDHLHLGQQDIGERPSDLNTLLLRLVDRAAALKA